jgi:hypothetical protein
VRDRRLNGTVLGVVLGIVYSAYRTPYSEYFEYTEKTKEYSSTPLRSGTSLQDTFKRIKFISSVQHP